MIIWGEAVEMPKNGLDNRCGFVKINIKIKKPQINEVFLFCILTIVADYSFSAISLRTLSRKLAAESRPPRPKAKPNAKAKATITPVNNV